MFLMLFMITWNFWLLPHNRSSTKQTAILIMTLFSQYVNKSCLAGLLPILINLPVNFRYQCLLPVTYPERFWAYHYPHSKWFWRDHNVPSSFMLKCWWPSIGWNPWSLHAYALERFTMNKVCFYNWKHWTYIAYNRKYQLKEKCIYFFGHQNLVAHNGVLVWRYL